MADESLRVTEGMAAGTAIELGDEFVIGRAMVGEGRLGEDPELSRRHARIARRAGDQLTIEDLGSTNGTFLNGRPLDGTEVLRPGDTIKLGTTTLQVLDASGQAPQATAFRKVLEPKDQATVPRDVGPPAPAPQARPAPPPAAPRAPARPAPAAPPPRTGRPPGAGGRRPPVPLIAAGAALVRCRRARRRAAVGRRQRRAEGRSATREIVDQNRRRDGEHQHPRPGARRER